MSQIKSGLDQRLEFFEVNYTPIGVVRQGLLTLKTRLNLEVRRFLDPCAGAGVYCQVVRELWPDAFICAVEPRAEERAGLLQIADRGIPHRAIDPLSKARLGRRHLLFAFLLGHPARTERRMAFDSTAVLELGAAE